MNRHNIGHPNGSRAVALPKSYLICSAGLFTLCTLHPNNNKLFFRGVITVRSDRSHDFTAYNYVLTYLRRTFVYIHIYTERKNIGKLNLLFTKYIKSISSAPRWSLVIPTRWEHIMEPRPLWSRIWIKVNSVQEACAKCFAVHMLKFEILQITWK